MNLEFFFRSMGWPLAATLVLTGIHVYLGIHVIGRKVIFVDLALAQIAALGSAVGVALGFEKQHDPLALFGYSLAFTVAAALVFSITKMRSEDIPHEAIIGITYAVAVAATFLVLSRSPIGPQEFDRMIKGDILYVSGEKVAVTAAIYAAVGLFHWICRRPFLALSFGIGEPPKHPRLWDFVFYVSFGFVVTSSVAIAGVFLVFSYLVIPAVGALMLSRRLATRLAIGWISGAVISTIGVVVSYQAGLPTSPLIVVFFAAALMLVAVVRYVVRHPNRPRALRNVAAYVALFGLSAGGLYLTRKHEDDPFERAVHLAHSDSETERMLALSLWAGLPERAGEWFPQARRLLEDRSTQVRRHAIETLARLHNEAFVDALAARLRDADPAVRQAALEGLKQHFHVPRVSEAFLAAAAVEEDDDLRVELLEAALELGDRRAVDELLKIIENPEIGRLWRREAYEHLKSHVAFEFTIETLANFKAWWTAHRDRLLWDPERRVFHE